MLRSDAALALLGSSQPTPEQTTSVASCFQAVSTAAHAALEGDPFLCLAQCRFSFPAMGLSLQAM